MSAAAAVANHLYLAAATPAYARFMRAVRNPERAQRELLMRLLRRNSTSAIGRRYGFTSIKSVDDFRQCVPLHDYEDYRPDIALVSDGAPRVLTGEAVKFIEPSGGSSGISKDVPYTVSLLAEFSAATMPWLFDLIRSRPRLRTGRTYWAVSPPARRASHTAGGLPIGMPHDSDYFAPVARIFLDRALGIPRVVSRASDIRTCRYLTLLSLLGMPDLALVSVWHPSFLTLLAEALDESFDALLHDLEHGTISAELPTDLRTEAERALPANAPLASLLRRRFGSRAPEDLGQLWQKLDLISCWADGHAPRALNGMRRRFPHVEVQGKGLLATEGVISIPMHGVNVPVCAVASHFLEFVPLGQRDETVLAHELDRGCSYEVVLTTGGGLYRYRLRDIVQVCGHIGRTPLLKFVGRADAVSDIAGEKLSPALVESVLTAAIAEEHIETSFAMLAPSWGTPPKYRVYVEACDEHACRLSARVENLLLQSHPYALCRALGQLGAIEGVAITRGAHRYEQARAARGQRAGTIKPAALECGFDWDTVFANA
ncbi:MAG: GH3 family domain-containing protein [Gemmatimonadaceae bacterium]